MRARNPVNVAILGLVAAIAAIALSLCIGVIHVPIGEVARVLPDFVMGRDRETSMASTLVLEMRLPRAVGAFFVGAALGSAGAMLQALLRDPLASPTLIGTAQASAFGRVLGVFLGMSYVGSLLLSFLTAVAGTLIVLVIARSRRGMPSQAVLLTGVNVGMLFAALIGLVQYMSTDEGQLSRMVLLLLGGLWQVTWPPLALIVPATLVCIGAGLLLSRHLDLLSLGEDSALRLGMNTRSSGTAVLLLSCLLTSLAVSIAGIVAFVGLVVPHAARRLVGPAHRALLPACAFLGGILVVAVDCVARTALPPNELPLGVLTSLVGVPFFLVVMHSMVREGATR
ncbi:MAG TPA: iron ABC transporter permease [Planctomycetota bacterium]|nr:iron ABC transporter permease [Planctomycetota bacterium]